MMPRILTIWLFVAMQTWLPTVVAQEAPRRPNVLWFVVDDMSANFSCYGETSIATPHVDRLAAEGLRFSQAYITAPVCSPCRSALITGMYQTAIGAHHHRSGRGQLKIQLPPQVRPLPELFQKAGYYTCIGDGLIENDLIENGLKENGKEEIRTGEGSKAKTNNRAKAAKSQLGKTDYNFQYDPTMYDSHDWLGRKEGQPFFMQVQLAGGKLRGGTDESAAKLSERAAKKFGKAVQPDSVQLPPYYPPSPVIQRDWAAYLDSVRFTDEHVGQVLKRLEQEGLLENTLVIFLTDHGISHARGKQFLYNEGTHVPLIVRAPRNFPSLLATMPPGSARDDLVEHIDIAAVSLTAAGIPMPTSMQARNILAGDYRHRNEVFAARDRCDETIERLRSVRTQRYLYIRNFYPDQPHLQPNAYKDGKSILQDLRRLHAAHQLPELSERLLFSPKRSPEELYDCKADPWQLSNLAGAAEHAETLQILRARLDRWMVETTDHGAESEAQYDSDMAVYVGKGNPAVEKNIAHMKLWAYPK